MTCSRLCKTLRLGQVPGGAPRIPVRTTVSPITFPVCGYCGGVYTARTSRHLHRAEPCRLAHQRAAAARFVQRWTEATGNVTASGIHQPHLSFEERLHSRYVVLESGCWQWVGTFNSSGYGQMGRAGRSIPAHVAVWEDHHPCCLGGPECNIRAARAQKIFRLEHFGVPTPGVRNFLSPESQRVVSGTGSGPSGRFGHL
ncbi:MAG: hypothetical protein WKF50_08320 [Nocardioides sp.]